MAMYKVIIFYNFLMLKIKKYKMGNLLNSLYQRLICKLSTLIKGCRTNLLLGVWAITPFMLCGCNPVSWLSNSYDLASSPWQARGTGDTTIDLAVMSKTKITLLRKNRYLCNMVDFFVFEKRLLVWGSVETEKQRQSILKTLRTIPYVLEIIDCIQIDEARTNLHIANDKWLTTKVNVAMSNLKAIKSQNYKIITYKSAVHVMGIAKSITELAYTVDLISKITGVKKVISFVRVDSVDPKAQ